MPARRTRFGGLSGFSSLSFFTRYDSVTAGERPGSYPWSLEKMFLAATGSREPCEQRG
jgi:hypothetical protein